MEKPYGQFIGDLPVAEIKKDFQLGSDAIAFVLKQYIKMFGYPDIGGAVRFPKVLARLSPQSGEKILDIGCGRGFYSHYIAKMGADVVGIDDGPFVEISQSIGKNLKVSAKIERVDITKTQEYFDGAKELFDKIIAIEVLEHLVDDKKAFSNWCQLLKSGGTMIFSVPLTTEKEISEFKPDLINDPYGHKRAGYTLEQIQQLCLDNSMKLVEYGAHSADASNKNALRNADYYNHKNFINVLLAFPFWKMTASKELVSNSSTEGYHQIVMTLKKD